MARLLQPIECFRFFFKTKNIAKNFSIWLKMGVCAVQTKVGLRVKIMDFYIHFLFERRFKKMFYWFPSQKYFIGYYSIFFAKSGCTIIATLNNFFCLGIKK